MADIIASQTPPLLHGPSDKEKKYDRQLRLWAASGQAALERAHILLVNSGSGTVGVEALKNLVLPGIGQFTIADEAPVDEADLGVNFFLDEDSLGKSRAESCTKLLQELNPDVQGDWYPKKEGEQIVDLFRNPATFTLILYAYPIKTDLLDTITNYATQHQIPLVSLQSVGFYSSFKINYPGSFPIVDTHPDTTATTDLRLLTPWPELLEFAKELTADISKLSAHEHGHIPYAVLLIYYVEKWKESHSGNPPSTYAEKVAFRKLVAEGARKDNPEGGEENYDEAVAAVLKTIVKPTVSSAVKEIFDYTPNEKEASSSFWIIADAIKQFYAKHNELPLPGSVPDMKAQSHVYVQLQNIYKRKARQDAAEVIATVRSSPFPIAQSIEEDEVVLFCKNAAFVKLVNGSRIQASNMEQLAESELKAEFALAPTLLPVYLALDASINTPNASASEIIAAISKVVPDASSDERIIQAAEEVARAKGSELHNISSLTGGMVSQEIIKLITKQYVPIENTCVFDGISSRTQVFKL